MKPRKIAAAALVLSSALLAQADLAQPSFEVASIKPSAPDDRIIGMFTNPGGRITVTLYTLKMLIHDAYGVQDFQISGGPRWTETDRYNLIAQPSASSASAKLTTPNPKLPPPPEELRMLQNLLADRFKLKFHRETKEGPVYDLIVAGKGPKLKPAKSADDFPVVGYGRTGRADSPDFMMGENASMQRLATRLSTEFARPVIDRTGLPGTFDFRFEYTKDSSQPGPSLMQVIQDDLGLKLVPARGPVETFVIDSAEKPSGN
jgi:uncharacterized protein (TIGR03435 family)